MYGMNVNYFVWRPVNVLMNECLNFEWLFIFYTTLVKVSFNYFLLTLVLLLYQDNSLSLLLPRLNRGGPNSKCPRGPGDPDVEYLGAVKDVGCLAPDLFALLIPSSANPRRDGHLNSLNPLLPFTSWVGLILFCIVKFIFEWSYFVLHLTIYNAYFCDPSF